MKRFLFPLFLALILFTQQAIGTSAANDRHRKPHRRTVVVVHKRFPIHRPLRHVVVRPLLRPYRVAPRLFLPLVTWTAVVSLTAPGRDLLVWEDGQNLRQEEDWTEFTLNCENTGTKLWLEVVSGRIAFDWAEVVFENGETQVIEMNEAVRDPGLYLLLDFANGRMVDHVRIIAKTITTEARVVLKMEK